jgi:malyl-CoA/(S)-citramalyl-CoA lyase
VLSDPRPDGAARASVQQDIWHYTLARMVDACAAVGIKPFYGPFGDIADVEACEQQFRNAFLLGCAGAWSLHPDQISIAKRVFSPDPAEVAFARRILEAMPDGAGVAMIDGRMQDDATWKQAKVLVDLAKTVVAREPERSAEYGF